MSKQHYHWWGYVRYIIQEYPGRKGKEFHGCTAEDQKAVQAAIDAIKRMGGSEDCLKVIRMVHWDRTHTLEGAALSIPCDKATAYRWQRKFFEEVARNRGLLD